MIYGSNKGRLNGLVLDHVAGMKLLRQNIIIIVPSFDLLQYTMNCVG